jgi:class 3 adenylate cyclase
MESHKINFERKLVTILSADIVGFSRMMAKKEENTLEIFIGHKQIFEATVAEFKGRIFNTAGDGILAEFSSVVEGVRCAIKIQELLWNLNKDKDPSEQVNFRIGINMGDVVVQGTDLLGDGVNIAARVQTVAMAGGICMTGTVFEQVQGKISAPMIFMGDRIYKNIPKPVPTYAVKMPDRALAIEKATARPPTIEQEAQRTWGFEIFLVASILSFVGFIYLTKEEGLQFKGVNCTTISESIPKELIDPSLSMFSKNVEMMKQQISCTKKMSCFVLTKPWLGFELPSAPKQFPFSNDAFYLDNGLVMSAAISADQSEIRFRAVAHRTDTNVKWGPMECFSSLKAATVFPGLRKVAKLLGVQ